jgi:hypothetical protein
MPPSDREELLHVPRQIALSIVTEIQKYVVLPNYSICPEFLLHFFYIEKGTNIIILSVNKGGFHDLS